MKVCILGSVALPVPPPMQGGTERIAWYQARGLAAKAHEVILLAAHGSAFDTSYKLVEIGGGDTVEGSASANIKYQISNIKNETENKEVQMTEITETSRKMRKEAVYWAKVAQWLMEHTDSYDIILNNMRGAEATLVPVAKMIGKPFVTVMHLPLFDQLAELYREYFTPIITISNAQKDIFVGLNYAGTVYNCVDFSQYQLFDSPGKYLLMMGSIAPHKNQKEGIEVAKRAGRKIILAGKVSNPRYFETEIAPLIDNENVRHLGEIGMDEKIKLYGEAEALLFPIKWEEPFGLVMIEAMACGTPVVAYGRGAIPEVVSDGKTGFIVDEKDSNITNPLARSGQDQDNSQMIERHWVVGKTGVEGLVEAVSRIGEIDRVACRKHVEENFSVEKMTESLEKALLGVINK